MDDSVRKIIRGVLKEFISDRELSKVEDYADDLFNPLGIDVEFTDHFRERLNHPRNRKQIETDELKDLFRKLYLKYGQKLPNFRKGTDAIVSDMNTNIHIPFEMKWDKEKKEFDMMNKTIMRTKKFFSQDMPLKV